VEKDVLIITNGYVLTGDPANRGGRYDLLIRDGRIAGIAGDSMAFQNLHPEARIISAEQKLILPGFVNAHFHSESILLRALTEGRHYGLWSRDVRLRRASADLLQPSAHDDLRSLYLTSYYSHLKSGTTSVGEFPPAVDDQGLQILVQSIARTDVRCVLTLQTWPHIEQVRTSNPGLRGYLMSVGPEEEYTVYSVGNLVRSARDMGLALLVHAAERRDDVETVSRNFQKGLGAVLRDLGALRPETVLIHLNHAGGQDLDLIEEAGSTVILCARSAAYKQTGYPMLRHLAARSMRLALGTDWAHVDMMEELRFLAELPLLVPGIPTFSPLELVRMATIHGAHALGVAGETGSLEIGKKADLTFFSLKDLRQPFVPPHPGARELAAFLVSHLSSRDITDVMINGQFAVSDGQIMTMTEDDVHSGFRKTLERWYPAHAVPAEGGERETLWPPDRSPQARIIPFVVKEYPVLSTETEGFEEGFSVIDTSAQTPGPPETPPPTPQAPAAGEPESAKPELRKEVRRVFGEDDEP
jgi:5-methylthioadenosine/S-adenosylhomocysteine deaminase